MNQGNKFALKPRPSAFLLCCILLVSAILRVVIAVRGGQFFWTDESRYVTSRLALDDFIKGDFRAGMDALFSAADHQLFKVIGVIPAMIERPFGNPAWIPAAFFGSFSVLLIYLVWRLVRDLGGTELEALCSAFLISTSTAFFYYTRHVFPYDLALCFFVGSAIWGLRPGRKMLFIAGMLSGLGFLCYNGYWLVGAIVMTLTVLARRRTPRDFVIDGALGLAGLLLPIFVVILTGKVLGHDLIRSFLDFSKTTTGDLGTAWYIVPKYFWYSEHCISLFWAVALMAAIKACLARRLDSWALIPLAGLCLFYAGLVGLSDVFGHIAVYARHTRPFALFACILGGWLLSKMLEHGRYGKAAFGLTITAIAVQFALNIIVPIRQTFPPEFNVRARSVIQQDLATDPGLYRVYSDGWANDPQQLAIERRPSTILYRRPHPLQFRPYALDGFNEELRGSFLTEDISMRVVRLLPEKPEGRPQISRAAGQWTPYPGGLRLELIFDPGVSRIPQPIVSSGRAGASDQVFVQFVGKNEIRFGIDNWGIGATYSRTISCDYSQPHVLIVSVGSLYPDESSPSFRENPDWTYLKHTSIITFDGEPVYVQPMECYPALPLSVVLFHNMVGLSSSMEEFQGRVLSASPASPEEIFSQINPIGHGRPFIPARSP
jgi:hypothetical protein